MDNKVRKLKRFLIVIVLMAGVFAIWVEIANRNSKNMTYRQKILKTVYPAIMWFSRITGKKDSSIQNDKTPLMSFYDLHITLNNGKEFLFSELKDDYSEDQLLVLRQRITQHHENAKNRMASN